MSIKLINSSPAISEQDIEKAELFLGFPIPREINEIYRKNNGGVLEDDKCIYQSESHELDIKYFLPIGKSKEPGIFTIENLYKKLAKEKKLIPEKMLPFAIDGGGFPFCIDIDNKSIYFLNLESGKEIFLDNDLISFINNIISEEDAWG
ncbi:SMI1/KNR4 family protein [Mangrovibacter phragmitis]|uniref:SMI1/KNR4 family protein n=1 Tax=Mangrovibacter phragmitis TaxID=1691903 RepID=UPI003369D5E1